MLNQNKKSDFGFILLIIYLIISPIYWLPGIDYNIIKYLKILLIILIIGYFIIDSKWIFTIPKPFKAPLIILVLWFIPFLLTTKKSIDILQLAIFYGNYFFGFLTAILAYNRYINYNSNISKFKFVFIGISFLCVFPISNFYFEVPNWLSPLAIENGTESLDVFWSTGFHGSRTGWSIVLSEFVPFSLLFILPKNNKKLSLKHLTLFLFILIPIVGAQIICMGRGGLLGSMISIFIILYKVFSRKILILFVGLSFFLFNSFANQIFFALRISDEDGRKQSLEDISSSRDKLIKQAPELIINSLLFGNGYKGSSITNDENIIRSDEKSQEIHNVFIRIFVDHGVIFGSIIMFFLFQIILNCIKILRLNEPPVLMIISCCIIISGIVSANFEPNTIFGNFQNLPLWWVSVGFVLFYKSNSKIVSV